MFGAPFSHTRFSLPQQGSSEIPIRLGLYTTLKGRFGAGADARIKNMALNASLNGTAKGVTALPTRFLAQAHLGGTASGWQAIAVAARPSLSLKCRGEMGANLFTGADLPAALKGTFRAGADIYSRFALEGKLNCQALLGANLGYAPHLTALLSGLADADLLWEETVQIAVSMPPGSELRIDSGNYTVTLNGKNILHLQQGDWLMLNRELAALTIDSGTGSALKGSVIYTEKYL